jgi:hypothetical protein
MAIERHRNHRQLPYLHSSTVGYSRSMQFYVADPGFADVGSLPESYRPLISSLTAVAMSTGKKLSPESLKEYIRVKYEHRLLLGKATSGQSALTAKTGGRFKRRGKKAKQKSDVVCTNCNKKGHTREECWNPGGGAEGKGPHQKKAVGHNAATATSSKGN